MSDNIDFTTFNVCSCNNGTSVPTVSAGSVIPLSNITKIGDGFSLSNNAITITGNIHYVSASAFWSCDGTQEGFKRVDIRKNGSSVAFAFTPNNTGYTCSSITDVLIPVSSGDVIDLYNRETQQTFWGTQLALRGY